MWLYLGGKIYLMIDSTDLKLNEPLLDSGVGGICRGGAVHSRAT